MIKFTSKLKNLREKNGVNQIFLAKAVGVSQSYISQLEQGRRIPSMDVLRKISSIIGVTSDELYKDYDFEANSLLRSTKGLSPRDLKEVMNFIDSLKQKKQTEPSTGGIV